MTESAPIREANADEFRLHLFWDEEENLGWSIWLDTQLGYRDGICIAVGKTITEAYNNAQAALRLCAERTAHLL